MYTGRFLLISITAHVAFFAMAWSVKNPLLVVPAPELSVWFSERQNDQQTRNNKKRIQAILHTRTRDTRNALARDDKQQEIPQIVVIDSANMTKNSDKRQVSISVHQINKQRRNNHLLSAVNGAVQEHFVYPPLALKHGWQGRVEVVIVLKENGQLRVLRILRSSGHSILDQDAILTLNRIGQIREARRWLSGRPYTLHFPVIYRISNI